MRQQRRIIISSFRRWSNDAQRAAFDHPRASAARAGDLVQQGGVLMCLACEEEAFYRAYLDHMEKKAKEAAAAEAANATPAVCDDAKERAAREASRKQ
jgi:hypothetical protein